MTAADRDLPALPPGLRQRVLTALLRARAAGRPVPVAPEIPAAEAYRRAASAFYAVLCRLTRISAPVLRPLGQANSKRSWRPFHQGTVVSAGRVAWRRTGE